MGVPSRLPRCWLSGGAAQRPVSCLLIWEMGTAAPPLGPCARYLPPCPSRGHGRVRACWGRQHPRLHV